MRHARLFLAASLASSLALCGALGVAAHAAPGDAAVSSLRAADNLSAEQQAQLDAWIAKQVNLIRGGLAEDVSAGREALINELRIPGASVAYKTALGRLVTPPVGDLLKSSKTQVRLNAAIILANVNNPDAILALAPAIQDQAAGVRLWAARAARMIIEPTSSERITLAATPEQALIKGIAAQIAKETDSAVYRELAETLITLGSAKAHDTLLTALDARVKAHVADAGLPFDIELRCINALYQKFLANDEKGPALFSLLGVAYRCEKLALTQMTAANADDKRLQDGRKAVILAADKMIRDQYKRLVDKQMPPVLAQLLPFPAKWQEAKDALGQWQTLLKDKPFSIPAAKLQ